MSRRNRGGEVNALAGQLAQASSEQAGRVWASMDADERAVWMAAWQPAALAARNRRVLPLSEGEIAAIVQTQRRIEPAVGQPPTVGTKEATAMVIDLRVRDRD
jgi:hypothetical protein